jgi:hypothetical protein
MHVPRNFFKKALPAEIVNGDTLIEYAIKGKALDGKDHMLGAATVGIQGIREKQKNLTLMTILRRRLGMLSLMCKLVTQKAIT